ncbi:MAG: hypothetical protein K2N66_06605, partial [Paramuribaculum sp.]|nr:hypothetical protein [Paramuribaculum sp.]
MDRYRRYSKVAFLIIAIAVVGVFLFVSNHIVTDLAAQERARIQLWADATREIVSSAPGADIELPLAIIQANTTIPVLLTDADGNIVDHRNFMLPEPVDSSQPLYISDANRAFLIDKLQSLRSSRREIAINIAPGLVQHLYY